MGRWLKRLLPLLGIAEMVLTYAGILSGRTYLILSVTVEFAFMLLVGRQVVRGVRQFRRERETGLGLWQAIEESIAAVVPRRVARIAMLESKL